MNVLYIHQYFSTRQGAVGTRSYEFAKALVAKGHQVTIICGSTQHGATGLSIPFFKGRRQGIVEGIEVIEFDLGYSNYDNFLKRAIKFFKFVIKTSQIVLVNNKFDLIFASSTPLTVAIPGILARLIKNKLFLFEVRDLWPELPKAMGVIKNPFILGAMSVLERLAYRFANYGIGLSPGICAGMARFGTLPKERIALIPNGCDLELFNQGFDNNNKLDLLLLELLSKKFAAIFCGAHGIANGLDIAINAAVILQEKGVKDIVLVFIGDGRMKPYLIDRAKKEHLSNCYFFDPIAKNLLPIVLQKSGVGMMLLQNVPAFYYGTSPNKFFDYLASGLPVLNNYPGWVAEMIGKFQCGVVVPPNNPGAFAHALIEFSNLSSEQREFFANNALKLAKEKFDRKILAKKFVELCERVYGEKNI